jgi:hypothetical protein
MALAVKPGTSSLVPAIAPVSTHSSLSRPIKTNANQTINTKFVVDWTNPTTLPLSNKTKTNDENLQNAFRRFREQRMVCL